MKRLAAICIIITIAFAAQAAEKKQSKSDVFSFDRTPIVLLFPIPDTESDARLAEEGTRAIKLYMRETGKAEVIEFEPDSPTVQRALIEKRIETEDLTNVITPESRLQMGAILGADAVFSGEISLLADRIDMSAWIGIVETGQIVRETVSAPISKEGNYQRARSNALQSAASSVVLRLAASVLKGVKSSDSYASLSNSGNPSKLIDPKADERLLVDDLEVRVKKAEDYAKAGDIPNAVAEYRAAINVEPTNVELRLRLVRLYAQRRMYTQAVDEIKRAQLFNPDDETLRAELAKIYEAKGSPELAAEIYVNEASRNPKDLSYRLKAGDAYWRNNMYEQAENEYRLAAELDPKDPMPHDKLAHILASQSLFYEARKELEILGELDPNPPAKRIVDRYAALSKYAARDITSLMAQHANATATFEQKSLTRESYYQIVKGIGLRMEAVREFLQSLTVPDPDKSTNQHRMLGCSLMSQSCQATLRYLETNKESEKEDAQIYLLEVQTHLNIR